MGRQETMMPFFENQHQSYLQRSQRGLWQHFRKREMATILKMLRPIRGQSLVDLGCGAGFYAIPLQVEYGMNVLAVDSSPGMLEGLKQKNIKTLLSPIESLGDIGRYDHALAAGVLEFIFPANVVFTKCRDFLNVGSKLIILIPTDNWAGWAYRLAHDWQGCRTYLRPVSEYQEMALAAGFRLKAVQRCTPISLAMHFERE